MILFLVEDGYGRKGMQVLLKCNLFIRFFLCFLFEQSHNRCLIQIFFNLNAELELSVFLLVVLRDTKLSSFKVLCWHKSSLLLVI